MPYAVELNRATGKKRLSWVGTKRGKVAPRSMSGSWGRRVIKISDTLEYHVTKGYRRARAA